VSLPPARGLPYRICLVCLGNICRSPIAAVVLATRVEQEALPVQVDSAGTGSWHIGEPADGRALDALRRAGYDGDAHRARQFDTSWFAARDLVLALDEANHDDLLALAPDDDARRRVRLLRSFDPAAVASGDLAVPDPYWGDAASFDQTLDIVRRAVDGLVDALRAGLR
jgi:protein-tyrosine phosphatase